MSKSKKGIVIADLFGDVVQQRRKIRVRDLAYIAGLFDGEGCIMMRTYTAKTGYLQSTYRVDISNTDRTTLHWVKGLFGGRIYPMNLKHKKPHHRICWNWCVGDKMAENFLRQILPYLRIKRRQADIALAFRATIQWRAANKRGKKKLSEEMIAKRKSLEDQLRVVKWS